jgi:uncharacterized repeat protein (TIGR03803 family)
MVATGILVLSAIGGLAAGRAGQKQSGTPEAKPSPQKATAASRVPEPKPGPQIEKLLRALEGTWSIKEKLAPDTASPNGAAGVGGIVWSAGPGGYSVVENYHSKEGGRTITGLGVFWWDEVAQGYRTIWCDSTNPGGCINFKNVAKWEGSQLVLVEGYEVNGKKFTFKEVFSDITPATFTQTLYGGEEGGELRIDQSIQATKLAGAALVQGTDGKFYGTTNEGGGASASGTVFSLPVGLGPFVVTDPTSGTVGTAVKILGTSDRRNQRHL